MFTVCASGAFPFIRTDFFKNTEPNRKNIWDLSMQEREELMDSRSTRFGILADVALAIGLIVAGILATQTLVLSGVIPADMGWALIGTGVGYWVGMQTTILALAAFVAPSTTRGQSQNSQPEPQKSGSL